MAEFGSDNDEIESFMESEYKNNDHKKVLNEHAFNAPELLNNRVLFSKVKNWNYFIILFFVINLFQITMESYNDYELFRNYDYYVERARSFYANVDFVNSGYLFNFIVLRKFKRRLVMAIVLL